MGEIKGVYCAECERMVGVYLSDNKISCINDIFCYLCANNLVLVADTLGFISPEGYAGCIKDLPCEQDLVELNEENKNVRKDASAWYLAIKKWSKIIRDEHQAEKIRKLQNEHS